MAGLESIAMAVAHLERIQSKEVTSSFKTIAEDQETDLEKKDGSRSGTECPPPKMPMTVPFGNAPRLVTRDDISPLSNVSSPNLESSTSSWQEGSAVGSGVPTGVPSATATERVPVLPADIPSSSSPRNEITTNEHVVEVADTPLPSLESILNADVSAAAFPPAPASNEEIHQVLSNDVLLGRGGETNNHTGNKRYRELVKACQPAYLLAKRREKPRIAKGIVLAVRKVGGRFLKKDDSNSWKDVGNTRAREKTSQALREGAPEMRSHMTANGDAPLAEAGEPVTEPVSSDSPGDHHHRHHAPPSPPQSHLAYPGQSPVLPPSQASYLGNHPHVHRMHPGLAAAQQAQVHGMTPLMVSSDAYTMLPPNAKRRRSSSNSVAASVVSISPVVAPPPSPSSGAWMITSNVPPTAPPARPSATATPTSNTATTGTAALVVGNPHMGGRLAATVSGDDEDSDGSEKEKRENDARGPRVKLLKKRLMEP